MLKHVSSPKDKISCSECPIYRSSIFCGLKKATLDRILRDRSTRRYEKRQVIHYQGTLSFGIFCIRSGLVKVFKTTPSNKQYIVRLAGPGHLLGLPTLVTGIPFLWTAEVVDAATICFIPRETLVPIVLENPPVALNLLKTLSHFVEESERERVELVHDSVRKRFARLLLFLVQSHGAPHPRGIQITASLSRRELAGLIGAAPETAMRLLKQFQEEGLLKTKGTEIIVSNSDSLKPLVD